jgi:putative addiction module killer protein
VDPRKRQALYYQPRSGLAPPFQAWRNGITDRASRLAVDARIARMRGGNFSDSRPIGNGASENRIDFGPGLRIYYGIDGERVILLHGGDKSSQSSDIAKALQFWQDYRERRREEKRKLQDRPARRAKK